MSWLVPSPAPNIGSDCDAISVDIGIEAISTETTTKRQHRPFTAIKKLDKASPLLMQHLVSGTSLGEVLVDYTLTDGASRATFKLRDAFVTSLEMSGDPDRPIITGKIDYTYAEWHVRQFGPDGTVIDLAATFYDMETGESNELGTPPQILQAAGAKVTAGETFTVEVTILDDDTNFKQLIPDVQVDSSALEVGSVKWMDSETLLISLSAKPTYGGQSKVTLQVSDGDNTTSMSFVVYADDTGTPWGGFLDAYFTPEEQLDLSISGTVTLPEGTNGYFIRLVGTM